MQLAERHLIRKDDPRFAVIDAVAFAQANLCQLAERLTDHVFQNPSTAPLVSRDEWTVKPLHMAQNGWAEEARAIANPSPDPLDPGVLTKRSKMRGNRSGGIPSPVSATETVTPLSSRAAVTRTEPPAGV